MSASGGSGSGGVASAAAGGNGAGASSGTGSAASGGGAGVTASGGTSGVSGSVGASSGSGGFAGITATGGGGGAGAGSAVGGASGAGSMDCGVITMSTKLSTPEGNYYAESAVPTGVCGATDMCSLVTIHMCTCGTFGAITAWSCACAAGTWSCGAQSLGSTPCLCSADAGTD